MKDILGERLQDWLDARSHPASRSSSSSLIIDIFSSLSHSENAYMASSSLTLTRFLFVTPDRNRRLLEEPKTDRIDAEKMEQLLKAGLFKPVFHTTNSLTDLRTIDAGCKVT